MLHHIRDLERLLGDKGVDVKPWTPRSAMDPSGPYGAGSSDDAWTQYGSVKIKGHATSIDGANIKPPTTVAPSAAAGGQIYLSPNFPRSQLESRPEDSSLGVGWDSRPLSSIRGTKLTIMGTTIDTTSFDAPDMDEPPADASIRTPLYNKSVHAFLQSAMGVNPPLQIELPSRNDAFTYSQWFFLIMSPYIPVLHQPTFMKLVSSSFHGL